MSDECPHENTEYEHGNYIPPYGWEIYPGLYCLDCGEMLADDEVEYPGAPGDDTDRYELLEEMRNPL